MTIARDRAADFDHLQTTLQVALRGRIRDLAVMPRDGGVELDGEALNYHVIQLVIRDVLAAGACIRQNRIRVRPANRC